MFKIKKMNKIAAVGLDVFDKTLFTASDDEQSPDGLLVRSAALHEYDFEANPELRAIARAGAGTNNIPIPACTERGIVVFNTPGANANAVKELVLTGLFLASRDVIGAVAWGKENLPGKGEETAKLVEKGKGQFAGHEIMGKKLGVIGLGAIGILVANAAAKLGMDVFGYDPYLTVDAAWKLSRDVHHVSRLEDLYKECDFITIHVPLLPTTKHTFNADAIASMKDGVILLNFARGELADDEALKAALESGKVARYVTDFPGALTYDMPNVIAIPHLGASTEEAEDNCAVMACRQLQDFFLNGNIVNSVNYPTVVGERTQGARFCVMHRNIPGVIERLSGVLAHGNINIENIISKSKGDAAYTVIDTSAREIPDGIDATMLGLEGIVRVFLLK